LGITHIKNNCISDEMPIIYKPPAEQTDPGTKPTRQGKLAQNASKLKEIYICKERNLTVKVFAGLV
jgi:hypothetical protein